VGLLAIALLAVSASGCGSGDKRAESRVDRGRDLYTAHCSSCHQIDGGGYAQVYPRLAGNPIVRLNDPAPTLEYVLSGRESMPGFRGTLTPREIADIVSYVRRAWGNDRSTVAIGEAR
jgi:mono/diheme cytochrome c family protein